MADTRKKLEENAAWSLILNDNISKIDAEIPAASAVNMLSRRLRESSLTVLDAITSDGQSLSRHAEGMSIDATGYAVKTGKFMSALETTKKQYELASELGKNLEGEAFSVYGNNWQEVARKFVQFVEMSSGQPAEIYFNPESNVFSSELKERYSDIFRFQNDIRGISKYEFEGAVAKTDSRKFAKQAAPQDKEIGILAGHIAKKIPIPDETARKWAKDFLEFAKAKAEIVSLEGFSKKHNAMLEFLVFRFLKRMDYDTPNIENAFVEAIKGALNEIAGKKNSQTVETKLQKGTAREIFARHLAATTGRDLESAAKIAAEYESYVLKSTNFPAFGDFCMQSGRSEGLAIHFISKYSIKCGISLSELGEFTEAVSLAAKELAAQAKPAAQNEEVAVQSDGSQMGSFRARIRGIVTGENAEKLVAKLEEAMKNGGAKPDKTLMKHQKLSNFDREMLNTKPPAQNLSDLMEFDVWTCAKAVVGTNQNILDGVLEAFRQVKKAATEIPPAEFTPKRWMEAFGVVLPWEITRRYGKDDLTKHLTEALSEAGLKMADLPGLDAPAMEKLADSLVEKNYRGLPHIGWNLRGDVCRAIQQANISEESRMAQAKKKVESVSEKPAAAETAKLSEEYVGKLNDSFTKRRIIEELNARRSQPQGQHFQKKHHHRRW